MQSVYYGRNINHNYAYCLQNTKLENLNVNKDLGVNFYPGLNFVLHCQKINKAYAMLRIIRRNFMYLSKKAFGLLYKAHVRSQLEYSNSVWNPYRMGSIRESTNESH